MPSRKGSPNRNKSFLLNRLQDMYGKDFHPIIKMAENCVELQGRVESIEIPVPEKAPTTEEIDEIVAARNNKVTAIKDANSEWARIAEYTEPKLKATEISGPGGGDIGIDHMFTVEFINAPSTDQ